MTLNSVKSLHFIINKANGYIDEHNGNRYLTLLHTYKGKEALKSLDNYSKKLKTLLDQPVIAQKIMMRNT